jgi:hypothetical protein
MPSGHYTRREAVLAIAALALAPGARADSAPPPPGSARYHVELVVFRQLGAPPRALPAPEIAAGSTLPGRVLVLPDASWQLGALAGGLAQHGYAPLAHSAWTAIVPPNGRTTAHTEDLLPAAAAVAGSIAVQRGQYLFVGLELDYRGAAGQVYGMREKRRVKFGERHYFDHPAFGAIVAIAAPRGAAADADG